MKRIFLMTIVVSITCVATAKVDLAVLPARDTTQLTIYNSADLTLVRESRPLTLKLGENKLQFSWENTLIDPTSLEMLPKASADKIDIAELVYPPRVRNMGLWNIKSEIADKVPVEITYLTSGLTWRAFYMGTLSKDEKTMRLQGYVRVTNNSGEDYENAQTRLIVGKVHMLDQIAQLARRQYPYGRPGQIQPLSEDRSSVTRVSQKQKPIMLGRMVMAKMESSARPKEIKREGLSEYFLYTIEGTETIPTGFSKRLPSFDVDGVGVVNLYKFEQQRYGSAVIRFLSFKNDEEHELGQTPIPGGVIKVYRDLAQNNHLSYTGQSSFKYIPVNEKVELNLGAVADVVVEPKLANFETDNYRFDRKGNIDGWDDIHTFKVEVRNTRDIPVKVEIKRNFESTYWEIDNSGDFGKYEMEDANTVKYTLLLKPHSKGQFQYVLRVYQGTRREDWTRKHR